MGRGVIEAIRVPKLFVAGREDGPAAAALRH
jgi:hypothetical protein